MIKLYGIPHSRAFRPLWMLEELGLEYENVPVNFVGDVKKPDYLKLNPNGRIPTLDDDGTVIWESLAINLYLAQKYGRGKLWPESEADQAHTLKWSFWAMTELEPPLMKILLNRTFLPEDQRQESEAKAGEGELQQPLRVLEGALEGRGYLLGSEFMAVDLNVCSVLSILSTFNLLDFSSYPNVSGWLAACTGRPSMGRVFGR
jgi:glutathione S-transferase